MNKDVHVYIYIGGLPTGQIFLYNHVHEYYSD